MSLRDVVALIKRVNARIPDSVVPETARVLQLENERLRKALKRYGNHERDCYIAGYGPRDCACGLTTVLSGHSSAPENSSPPNTPSAAASEGLSDETSAWLIEMAGERAQPLYWHAEPDMRCIGGFDPDVNKAMRFCREKDARAMALMLGAKGIIALTEVRHVRITAHAWAPSAQETSCTHPVVSEEG